MHYHKSIEIEPRWCRGVLDTTLCDMLIISIFIRKTRIIRSILDEVKKRMWYGLDNPCLAKKNTNHFFIGNFTILAPLCDLFVLFWTFFLNERFSNVTLDCAWQMTKADNFWYHESVVNWTLLLNLTGSKDQRKL